MSCDEWWECMYFPDEEPTEAESGQYHSWRLTVPDTVATQVNWEKQDDDSYLIQNLRPLAESLSLLEYASNGMLTHWREWLPAALQITLNSRTEKWQELSWIRNLVHETPMVEESYQTWQTLKKLSKNP